MAVSRISQLTHPRAALHNQDALEMLAGLSPRIVAEQIKRPVGNFDLSIETLKKMQADGLPEIVILAIESLLPDISVTIDQLSVLRKLIMPA